MEFRLTYEGKLLSTRGQITQAHATNGGVETKWEHKHCIRKQFHRQLKVLWETHPTLTGWSKEEAEFGDDSPLRKTKLQYRSPNFNWLPLVTPGLRLNCHLDVLYLRNGARGDVLSSSDIDNRMKTLIDALKIPGAGEIDVNEKADVAQDPFYVLMSSDSLVTKLSVEADMLLSPTDPKLQDADSRVVITVRIWPYTGTWQNLSMGF